MPNYQINIPEEELNQFQSFVTIYSEGKMIVREGDAHDTRIFLLRQGKVKVLRWVGEDQQLLSEIEAVNFFGEVSAMTSKPRSATIIAASDPVVVYAFEKSNLPAILTNYKWSSMLIRRLTDNLLKMNEDYEQAQVKVNQLRLAANNLLSVLLSMYHASGQDPSLRKMIIDTLPNLIQAHMHETGIDAIRPDTYLLEQYNRRGILSEQLYTTVLSAINRSDRKLDI